jgi:hypothetical protein
MSKHYFKTYIWLLETLQSRGRLTLAEIKALWLRSSINDEGKDLATRTFANHIASIADIFGIDIVCDRRDNTYRIDNADALSGGGVREWLMEALSINNLINESAGLRTRILFESVPSSHRFLTEIIRAVKDGRMLEVNYRGFGMEAPRDFLLEPYCLKEYKRRWSLFACKSGIDREPHNFALDRMNSVRVSDRPFTVPKGFDAEEFFRTRYGVLKYDDGKPAVIRLKVAARQADYLRTLPLHSSQQETETAADYAVFSYYLIPNYDFIHDILYYGSEVEVLGPESLRETMKKTAERLCENYNR